MKIAFIHPLKHHIYYSMAGALDGRNEVVGLLGYYNRNDIIDRLLIKLNFKKLVDGYKYRKIDEFVKTNCFVKMLFLLYKSCPKLFWRTYLFFYELWVISNLKNIDCIHVLQDYCNRVIRYASKKNIMIVYEQITAYNPQSFLDNSEDKTECKSLSKQRENIELARHILMPSNFVVSSIESQLGNLFSSKFKVIPYGADTARFCYRKREITADKPLKLLVVASLSKRKGLHFLFEAMKRFNRKQVILTVIGACNTNEPKLLKDIQSTDNIEYLGEVPHTIIHSFYNQCDVFILPSLYEGSSLSVYEALASGMPCIVTKNVGSVIRDGVDGIIIEANSITSIENAICLLLKNPLIVSKMSEEAKKTASLYTWTEYEKQIRRFYEDIQNEQKK